MPSTSSGTCSEQQEDGTAAERRSGGLDVTPDQVRAATIDELHQAFRS
ncbi:hypothetical protein ACF1BP_30180 [Streptomyces sp. NPDC014735]